MGEQLSLFVEENTLFNKGIQQLLDMDFGRSMETLRHYSRIYPWGRDVSREIAIAEFWTDKIGETLWDRIGAAGAEEIFGHWLEFEETFNHPWPEGSVEHLFRARYFSRLAEGLDKSGDGRAPRLGRGVPTGLVYLLAGRPVTAISSLQALIAIEPEDAAAYGYLGDAHLMRKDLPTARICYRMAFALAPDRVDIKRLRDTELKERLEDLQEEEELADNPLGWFPVIAQIEGLFEPQMINDLGQARYWLRRYQELLDAYDRDGLKTLVPRLFYHAMVLSDNAATVGWIGEVDLIDIRQKMREWKPDLFALYMRELRERESRSRATPA